MAVEVFRVLGAEAEKYLDSVAQLRIRVFRDFPYLYDGHPAYEKEYLGRYLQARDFALIVAKEGKQVVGASTCLPLSQETDEIRQPLVEAGYDDKEVLYLGESVLDKAYRGRGIGKSFFRLREAYGHHLQKTLASFCAVDRPADHPLRPAHYRPLHTFWQKEGYRPLANVQVRLFWKDVDQKAETEKALTFWIKKL
jgi:GNAT superfamily N-acetyltransferase